MIERQSDFDIEMMIQFRESSFREKLEPVWGGPPRPSARLTID
jgi:hypothetical protein